jgi:hypothetical protein
VADDTGKALLNLLRNSLTTLLSDALADLAAGNGLADLEPVGPEWGGSGFEQRLLTPPTGDGGGAVTARVIVAMRKLALISGPTASAGLFGWDPDPVAHSRSRGIATAVRVGPQGNPNFAAALAITIDATGKANIDIVGKANTGAGSTPLQIDGEWGLSVGGQVAGVIEVGLPATGPATVALGAIADVIRVGVTRPAPSGGGAGPGIDLGAVELNAALSVDGPSPALTGGMRISGGRVRITPGDLSSILPALAPVPLDVALGLSSSRGVDLAGSPTLAVRLPSGGSVQGLTTGPLDVALIPNPGNARVQVRVTCPVSVDLPAVPIHLDLDDLGFEVPFLLGGGGLGFDLQVPVPQSPTGAGVALALSIVKGAGHMAHTGDTYSGMLAVVMPPMAVTALGSLNTRTGSFLVVLGAVFPPPGIQIGFGFAVTGVGGIVGAGRCIDRDALALSVQDGTAASLLFPSDPAKASREILPALDRIFPSKPGSVVVGPMFQVSWGGRIVTGSVALILELPDPVRISILGKLLIAVPDPEIPLIRLQVTFFGQIDPSEPSLMFLASLTDSNIAGITISGDMYVLVRGGSAADVVVSAGGFHPQFSRPPGVPALNRIAMTISSGSFLQLRCEAYLAVTSNTLQFGARVDLVAEIAGCGLRGHLGFDVLIQFSPFHFIAQISASIAVEVVGETLAGISLSLALEGPGRWRAAGRGRVDIFLFSASFDFDESWGSAPAQALGTPDIKGLIEKAFSDPAAWIARAPDPTSAPVQLTIAGGRLLADGSELHPHGSLSARQKLVPLGITLDQFNRIPIAPQKWDVSGPGLGANRPAPTTGEEREQFAPAAFQSMDDDAALNRPAFESFRVGLSIVAGDIVVSGDRTADFDYETKVIAPAAADSTALRVDVGSLFAKVERVSGMGIDDPRWWKREDDVVAVTDSPTFAVVDAWSFTEAPDIDADSRNATAQYEAAAAVRLADPSRNIHVVEAWEVVAR